MSENARVCSGCGTMGRVHRSHARTSIEKSIKNVSRFRPYRCHECGKRSWVWVKREASGSAFDRTKYPVWLLALLVSLTILIAYMIARPGL